ncbi:short transient receptor potential channel 3-like, partial [Paramuricea clavata]
FSKAWQLMFWALFDQADMENFGKTHPRYKITSETGKFLFAIYLIFAVVVGINMLIAMMNNSFEYVAEDKRCLNWKMSRTAMWLEFTDKADFWLPPPYNILHYLIYFVMHIK